MDKQFGQGCVVICDKGALDATDIKKLENLGFVVIEKGGGRDVFIERFPDPRPYVSMTEK